MGEVIRLRVASSEEAITLQSASGSLAVEAVSPHVAFERVSGGTKMSVTDVDGTQDVIIPDGAPGQDGEPGQDGFSPSASVTKSGGTATITITDKNGTTTASVSEVTVDNSMSDSSTNPVENRVIKNALGGLEWSLTESIGMVSGRVDDLEDDVVGNTADIGLLKTRVSNVESGKQNTLTFDQNPKSGSLNPVTSMGIKQAIDSAKALIPTKVSDLTDDSGHYTKPSGGIPASDIASGVIPDVSGKQDALTFDSAPTASSTNPVTSGGVYDAVADLKNSISCVATVTTKDIATSLHSQGKGRWTISGTTVSFISAETGYNFAQDPITVTPGDVVHIVFNSASGESIIFANYADGIYTLVSSESPGRTNGIERTYTIPSGVNRILLTKYGGSDAYCNPVVPKADSAPTSGSINPVTSGGVYTALQAKADPVTVETVSGTDPVIVGADNHRYVCGTVDTLSITVPASGIIDVVFTSDTTPTVLSVTPPSGKTMLWPGWFNPSALDASTVYEINIMDGVYGAVGVWT